MSGDESVTARPVPDGVKVTMEYVNRRREIVCAGVTLSTDEANALAKALHQAANR